MAITHTESLLSLPNLLSKKMLVYRAPTPQNPSMGYLTSLPDKMKHDAHYIISNAGRCEKSEPRIIKNNNPNNASMRKTVHTHPIVRYKVIKQTNKQPNKQSNIIKPSNNQTLKQPNKQTKSKASKQANKQTNKQANNQTNKQTKKQTNEQEHMSSWFPGSILFEICCDGLGAKNSQLRGKAKFGFEIAGKWRRFT